MDKKLFLDMDGVLADFIGGACAAHRRPNPYTLSSTSRASAGKFEIKDLWGMDSRTFWKPCNTEAFWEDLDKTEEADELVERGMEVFGDHVYVLTAPNESPYCVPGKLRWLSWHFPQLRKKVIFAKADLKRLLSGPNRLLIDDKDTNVDEWCAEEGGAILFPRPWNSMHPHSVRPMPTVNAFLNLWLAV